MTDAELIQTSLEFRNGLLGPGALRDGDCAKVSMALAGYLRVFCGVECECVETNLTENPNSQFYEHVWIRLSDGRALDATFDQFCSEEPVPVYLGKPTEFHIAPALF